MNRQQLHALLSLHIHPAWQKAEEKIIEPLLAKFIDAERQQSHAKMADKQAESAALTLRLIQFIQREIAQQREQLQALRLHHTEFTQRYAHAISEEEQRHHILDYAKALGQSAKGLKKDQRAFERWFGMDAVVDRYQRRHTRCERMISFCLGRFGVLSAHLIEQTAEPALQSSLWTRLALEQTIKPLLAHDGDNRVVVEAFRSLATALKALPASMQERAIHEGTLQFIYRSALEHHQQVWVQCEALNLLQSLSTASLVTALHQRLAKTVQTSAEDDLFVRRHAVELLGNNVAALPELAELIPVVLQDPSPYVRQQLAKVLPKASQGHVKQWLPQLLIKDESPQVRAAALLIFPMLVTTDGLLPFLLTLMRHLLGKEQDAFVLRTALKICVDRYLTLDADQANRWQQAVRPMLAELHAGADSIAVRRWAAQADEKLWCFSDSVAQPLCEQLSQWVSQQKPGKYRPIPRALLADVDEQTVGRVLSILALNDFGLDLMPGWWRKRLMRGHRFSFRFWRILHELRNPSSDKRQGFSHTVGRVFSGNLRAPSTVLAELAETKVPGEPLYLATEGGWRPYLPLLDDLISTLDSSSGRLQLYSSEGVTEIVAPAMLLQVKARCLLSLRFASLSRMRNWQEESQSAPSDYITALRQLGFKVHFHPHQRAGDSAHTDDSSVSRFFGAGMLIPLDEQWQQIEEYFFSVYQNSLHDLALFTALVLFYFVSKHLYANWRMHQVRKSLPLVTGGWGTRGKSGTERIKAAMINALGYGIVSKTTGCEAMFLYADPYGKMREMFLFRPYEKATIWEQFDVMRHAEGLKADVFLWECMALTPSYVRILQQDWVRDDLSTITNTFPDHEDLQGPAGINIPEVMTHFIPRNATLITSEELMLPILREAARQQHTRVEPVGWLEAGLLTPDVLQRFPYDEHPYNIALVIRMGQELGIPADFAVKEMADRVVADLGVLKTYPVADIKGRKLIFVNGMSANERFGCLSNWTRMGFDKSDITSEPGCWVSTVVNNRADRVARSRVFASVLAQNISADRHFIIGNNLNGFVGYIEQSWHSYAQQFTLWPEEATTPQAVLLSFAKRYRIATSEAAICSRLQAMLQALGIEAFGPLLPLWQQPEQLSKALSQAGLQTHADGITTLMQLMHKELLELEQFSQRLEGATPADQKQLDEALRQLLHQWFMRKIVVVHDYHATGDAVIDTICRETPPGITNRVMGIQNIKGTGLDFIYRWQAWDSCHTICSALRSGNPRETETAIRELAAFQEFGLLSEEHVRETLELVRNSTHMQRESYQAELQVIESNLKQALQKVRSKMTIVRGNSWLMSLLAVVEELLDAGDAVKRRKTADKVYRDLIDERISIEQAVVVLQTLNKRQKGGWLLGQLHQAKNYLKPRAVK